MTMSIAEKLAQYLLEIQAIKLNPTEPFTWASGMRSPIYCDNRLSLSYPPIRDFIKQEFVDLVKDMNFDGVAGVATAGIPHGTLLADALKVPFIYVRSKAKGHGRQNMIEGDIQSVKRVLVVEDLISTGGSCLQAVDALKNENIEVEHVVALFTYELEKATVAFQNANIPFTTISNYTALLEAASDSGYVNQSELATLKNWNEDPKAWSDKFIK